MNGVLGVLGAVAAVAYKILFDPSRRPTNAAWSATDYQVIAIYALVGFAVGWVVAIIISKVGHDK
jgi:hypothetical protein